MRVNYVLIDLENVQPKNLGLLEGDHYRIKVFHGAAQTKIPIGIAGALQPFGKEVEYVQIDGNGTNALDFHIAYYIGRLSRDGPDAYFHIISKDTGFDPLVRHLKKMKIKCVRSASIDAMPIVKAALAGTLPERINVVVENLQRRRGALPRTVKTLTSTVRAMFSERLADEEVHQILEQLQAQKITTVAGSKVSYELPA